MEKIENRKIIQDALKINEMEFAFECICADDKKNIEEYTDQQIIDEAEYRLYTYFQVGHSNNDEMRLGEDAECRAIARKDIRLLKAFIKKYKVANGPYSSWLKSIGQAVKSI